MTYETAKKLKDAGFPQIHDGGDDPSHEFIRQDGLTFGSTKEHNDYAMIPTLEELIEACGDRFECLIARGKGEGDNWEARSPDARYNATTMIEAVANLWLEINKK